MKRSVRQANGLSALAFLVFIAAGADCTRRVNLPWMAAPIPRVLSPNPTLDEVVRAVNGNSALVQSMSTNYASLSGQGAPSLRAAVFVEKPGRFRVRGSHALTGPEIDLGCNDELFWLWIKRSEPPAMYFARHSSLAGGMRRLIPLSPPQLVEALGLATFDPAASHQGPFQQGPDRLAIRSTVAGPEGIALTRTTIVDARSAWVLEQQLHDATGNLLATVATSNHRLDAASRAWLPHTVSLSVPSGGLSMMLTVDRWDVNVPPPADAWQKPEQAGYPNVDISDPSRLPAQGPVAGVGPPQAAPATADLRSRYGDRREEPIYDGQWRADIER